MPQETIKQVLMRRDKMSAEDANDLITGAKEELFMYLEQGDFCAAEDVCGDWFGLEPDYLDELITWKR